MKTEDTYFHQVKNIIKKQNKKQLQMLASQYQSKGNMICCELDRLNPEFRFVKSHFFESMAVSLKNKLSYNTEEQEHSQESSYFKVQQVYKLYDNKQQLQFEKTFKKVSPLAPKLSRSTIMKISTELILFHFVGYIISLLAALLR
jgi:hypothetical protein